MCLQLLTVILMICRAVRHEVDALRNDPAMLSRAVQDMLRRCQLCVESGGGHVEGVAAYPSWISPVIAEENLVNTDFHRLSCLAPITQTCQFQ